MQQLRDKMADQLVAYARQIAVYRGYNNLENGLQPPDVLNSKYEHEKEEFADVVTNKDIWHQYHEAADLFYYAACFDAQFSYDNGGPMPHYRLHLAEDIVINAGLDRNKAMKAALAKYGWRASGPNRKDEDFEIELIRNTW